MEGSNQPRPTYAYTRAQPKPLIKPNIEKANKASFAPEQRVSEKKTPVVDHPAAPKIANTPR